MIKTKVKKLVAAALAAAILIPTTVLMLPTSATIPAEYGLDSAQTLYELGLFQGVGEHADGSPDFDLDRTPTRNEAVTMLVRLLGKESVAQSGSAAWETPFEDLDDWAAPYVGYAYENQLTFGVSDTEFEGDAQITPTQYITFVLRALGYQSGTDFQWDAAWQLSDNIGITYGYFDADTDDFNRGDVACISEYALYAQMKSGGQNLLTHLKNAGALANSDLVLLGTYIPEDSFHDGLMSMVVYEVPGSPETFISFRVNSANVNGVRAKVEMQYTTNKAVLAAFSDLRESYPTALNRVQLSYDLDKAVAAATVTDHNGFPFMTVTLNCTVVTKAGKSESFTYAYSFYLDTVGL